MENNPTDTFDWGPFGEPRWRELGAAAGCSEKQLRYAVAKFQGASQTAAARLAGYESGGDDDSGMRRAGFGTIGTTIDVQILRRVFHKMGIPEAHTAGKNILCERYRKLLATIGNNTDHLAITEFLEKHKD
jgi:hypothetical protein